VAKAIFQQRIRPHVFEDQNLAGMQVTIICSVSTT